MKTRAAAASLAVSCCLLMIPVASAASIPVIGLKKLAEVGGVPTGIRAAGDGTDRLFITLRAGRIVIVSGGVELPDPFLDIRDKVIKDFLRGLLGLAFHPNYAQNGIFYVHYVALNGDDVIARYSVSADPDRADPGSEKILLEVPPPHPEFVHDGGELQFGPDGYLYISLGSTAPPLFPEDLAQDLGDLHGKMLRVDVDGGDPYAIPPTNPFVGTSGARGEIWAYGFRNPYRFSFDRATGDLWIGDVGGSRWEEVDFQAASSPGGENYGWWLMEGKHCLDPPQDCNDGTLTLPIIDYPHGGDPFDCAVMGGYTYRGSSFPLLDGVYFYADQCSGRIWGLSQDGGGVKNAELLVTRVSITTFGEDDAGGLYVGVAPGGRIYSISDLRPFCDVATDKTDYTDGETVTASVRRLVNLGDSPVPVRRRFAIVRPSRPPVVLSDIGGDGSFVLQPGTEEDFGPKALFDVGPGMERGSYSLECRLTDPSSGRLLAADRSAFEIN